MEPLRERRGRLLPGKDGRNSIYSCPLFNLLHEGPHFLSPPACLLPFTVTIFQLDTLPFFILSSCHNSTFLSLYYFLTFLLPSSSCHPVTTWPSCHYTISWHSFSFFFMSSCHNSTFLSLYYFLTFLLPSSSCHPATTWPSCHSPLSWPSFSSSSCPHVKSQPFLSLMFSVRPHVFFLFSCHNSTSCHHAVFCHSSRSSSSHHVISQPFLSLSHITFFFLSNCHNSTFLSPYCFMSFLPLFFLSSCHISAFPVTVSSFLTVTTQLSCHLTVFFHTPIVLLSSCHKTSFLSPNSFLLLLCFLSLVSLLLPVFLFYPFLFYLSSHLFLSVVSIIFKYCFVTFCHLSPFLLTHPPSPFHQRYIPSHRFACLTPGFLLRTLIIGVMQWCLLLQGLQISWLNS